MQNELREDEMPLGRAENLAGQKFGRLTALYRVKRKDTYWKCVCECGGETVARAADLKNGHTQSCGCFQKDQTRKDISGQKFGRLLAIKSLDKRIEGHVVWECLCDCGNIYEVKAVDLIRHHTESCGCYRLDRIREVVTKNITGQRFGKLTALEPTDDRYQQSIIWKCKCDCGEIVYAPTNVLLANRMVSCGCENISKGELIIRQLLQENDIYFESQKIFETCKYATGYPARFDFYIVEDDYLIEFDGAQHYKSVDFFGGDEEFKIQQERDNFKNQWCKNNSIPLIRIPYTQLSTLSLSDLLLETTQFRIV